MVSFTQWKIYTLHNTLLTVLSYGIISMSKRLSANQIPVDKRFLNLLDMDNLLGKTEIFRTLTLLTKPKTKKLSLVHVVYLIFTTFSTLATYSFKNLFFVTFYYCRKGAPKFDIPNKGKERRKCWTLQARFQMVLNRVHYKKINC